MKTILTLDDEVAEKLSLEMKKSGQSFEEVVNHFLRLGLETCSQNQSRHFVVKARPLRIKQGLSYDNIGQLLERIEGPLHK